MAELELVLSERQLGALADLMAAGGEQSLDALAASAVRRDRRRLVEVPYRRAPRPHPPSSPAPPIPGAVEATLPARSWRSVRLARGSRVRLEQIADGQCVDLFAVALTGEPRPFSASRTRAAAGLRPSVGAVLYSAVPEVELARVSADSAPAHDLSFPACSAREYEQVTGRPQPGGCSELALEALRDSGLPAALAHDPLNLWLPTSTDAAGHIHSRPVACRRGDYVDLEVLEEILLILTCCPDDLFGSSLYEPGPVRLLVGSPDGAEPQGPPGPPEDPPRATHVRIGVSRDIAEHLELVCASGWFGSEPAAVMRALLLSLWEEVLASEGPARPPAR